MSPGEPPEWARRQAANIADMEAASRPFPIPADLRKHPLQALLESCLEELKGIGRRLDVAARRDAGDAVKDGDWEKHNERQAEKARELQRMKEDERTRQH